jgi:1,6-anhydro-N-acetylmuramate kinase
MPVGAPFNYPPQEYEELLKLCEEHARLTKQAGQMRAELAQLLAIAVQELHQQIDTMHSIRAQFANPPVGVPSPPMPGMPGRDY